jgi:hypothetical protein
MGRRIWTKDEKLALKLDPPYMIPSNFVQARMSSDSHIIIEMTKSTRSGICLFDPHTSSMMFIRTNGIMQTSVPKSVRSVKTNSMIAQKAMLFSIVNIDLN